LIWIRINHFSPIRIWIRIFLHLFLHVHDQDPGSKRKEQL
jgi:hypothetical protein